MHFLWFYNPNNFFELEIIFNWNLLSVDKVHIFTYLHICLKKCNSRASPIFKQVWQKALFPKKSSTV